MQTNFSQNLRELRAKSGLKIKHLSDETEINRETIYSYESGKRVPTLKNLVILAKFFGVSLDKIVFESQRLRNGKASLTT